MRRGSLTEMRGLIDEERKLSSKLSDGSRSVLNTEDQLVLFDIHQIQMNLTEEVRRFKADKKLMETKLMNKDVSNCHLSTDLERIHREKELLSEELEKLRDKMFDEIQRLNSTEDRLLEVMQERRERLETLESMNQIQVQAKTESDAVETHSKELQQRCDTLQDELEFTRERYASAAKELSELKLDRTRCRCQFQIPELNCHGTDPGLMNIIKSQNVELVKLIVLLHDLVLSTHSQIDHVSIVT